VKSRRRAAGRGNPLLVAEQLNLLDVVSRGTAIMALAAGGDAMEFVGLGRGQRVAVASGARLKKSRPLRLAPRLVCYYALQIDILEKASGCSSSAGLPRGADMTDPQSV
jgi:hypothetical protein